MDNIIFISGLSRSGSSFFSCHLSSKFNLFLVGEAITNREIFSNSKLFNRYLGENRMCSCQKSIYTCPFWSRILKRIHPGQTFTDYYQGIIYHAKELSNRTNINLVDSSKNRRRLWQLARSLDGTDAKITCIHVLKHYRAQIVSGHKYSNRAYSFLPFRNTSLFHGFYWIYANSAQILTLILLKKMRLISDFTLVNYEDFIFAQSHVFEVLTRWNNSIFSIGTQECCTQQFHEMGGNESFKRSAFTSKYSHIWMKRSNAFSFILWAFFEIFYIIFQRFSLVK